MKPQREKPQFKKGDKVTTDGLKSGTVVKRDYSFGRLFYEVLWEGYSHTIFYKSNELEMYVGK